MKAPRKMRWLVAMALGAAGILLGSAGSPSTAWAAACLSNVSLQTYLGLPATGCDIGDKTFSNFTYVTSGTNQVPATGITVTTIAGPNIGLQFNGTFSANTGETSDGTIGFTVAVIGGGPLLIEDAALAQLAGATGTGTASVAEKGCVGPLPCTPNLFALLTLDSTTTSISTAHTFFTPTGKLSVEKDIGVIGGSNGFATLSQVQDTFSQTTAPEPATLGLLGAGLLGFGWVARRRRRAC